MLKHSPHPIRKASSARLKFTPERPGPERAPGAFKVGTPRSLACSSASEQGPAARGFATAPTTAAVAVFARAVVKGKTKTRLIPALGRDGAAEFHRALVSDMLRKVAKLKGNPARYVFTAGGKLPKEIVPRPLECRRQHGSDLAQRLQRAFTQLLRQHSRVIVVGTDSPALAPGMLRLALEELRTTDAVLGPCPDGGYYLLGLRRIRPGLFSSLRLGTEFAFDDTLGSLLAHGFSCSVLKACPDIDRPEDLVALKKSLIKNHAARRLMPSTSRFLSKTA